MTLFRLPTLSQAAIIRMMIKKSGFYITILILLPAITYAQEVVTGLQVNPVLKAGQENRRLQKKLTAGDTINLPFFDDFSDNSYLPSPKRWSDDFAFINNTYSNQQITVGIATLDAIDNNGNLYETANTDGFEADHLTSLPVNLSYPSTSNIYLSFFYQPGGLGDPPELKDSLTLQFYSPSEAQWHSVWKVEGSASTRFKPVIIKIDQPRYLQKGFKFRFVNWASLTSSLNEDPSFAGNCDIWNLDYVYLNANRNSADTSLADVAFRTPIRSLLKTHESMPWKEFQQVYLQEMGSFIPIHYRNNDTIVRNVTRNFEIRDVYSNKLSYSFSAGATNIDPMTNVDYNANLIYTYNTTNTDSARFRITCILKTDDFDPKQNDTIKYDQVFSNYFAFDDGTSEAGYGINGLGSRNAMVAYMFKSFMKDTVRAIMICFNDSYLNSNRRVFDLVIWGDSSDLPGDVLYTVENEIVEQGDKINGFYTYVLPEGVPVDGVFYIGWKQRSETYLNAGFDINTPHQGKQFYWLNGAWHQSQTVPDGCLMIRPVVGKALKTTGINDTPSTNTKRAFRLWPNPATGLINIQCTDLVSSWPAFIVIVDLQGRQQMKLQFQEQINISPLKAGMYTVILLQKNKPVGYLQLVKTR
jgi:hypothetical protein